MYSRREIYTLYLYYTIHTMPILYHTHDVYTISYTLYHIYYHRQQATMMRKNPQMVRDSQPAFNNMTNEQIMAYADQLEQVSGSWTRVDGHQAQPLLLPSIPNFGFLINIPTPFISTPRYINPFISIYHSCISKQAASDPEMMKEVEKMSKLSNVDRNALQSIQDGVTGNR